MKPPRTAAVAVALVLAALASLAGPPRAAEDEARRWIAFPPEELYPPYVADPQRPGFGIEAVGFTDASVADSGNQRVALKLGGRFGVLRFQPRGDAKGAWQVGIRAGFYGQFDIDHQQDNVGWDGTYGLVLTGALPRGLGLKLGLLHTSSHVGDEYAERTGRRRIGYTREEVTAGLSWPIAGRWRGYAEAGRGYALKRRPLQKPWRVQTGVVFEAPRSLWRSLGWYAATDLASTEERDWQVDVSLQAGLIVPSGYRRWRLGLSYRDGRVPIGEFFQDDERYVSAGLWLDL